MTINLYQDILNDKTLPRVELFRYSLAVFFVAILSLAVQGQINFNNPGLNGASAAGAAPGQWTVCSSTPDVQPGQWCVGLAPKEGNAYAGFSDDEFIGQRLNCSLVKGKNYSMSLWLAYNPDYARTQALGACPDRGIRGNPGNFQLWAGTTQCSKQELLYESGKLTAAHNNNWVEHKITFKPNNTFDFILICAKPDDGSTNVLVDNISQQIIQEPDSFSVDNSNIICFDDKTATATVYPPNVGGSNYTYRWNTNPVQTTQTATGLGVGVYTCTVTDNNGPCTSTFDVVTTVTGPPELKLNMVCTDVSLPGVINGTSTAIPTGGVPPYSYVWNTGVTGVNQLTGLDAGTYSVDITDANGCKISGSCSLINPFCDLTVTDTTIINPFCFGSNDGEISVTATSSNGPLTYAWDNYPSETTNKLDDLGPGNYRVVVRDASNCEVFVNVTLLEPAALDLQLAGTPASCFNGLDATATATVSGGTPPYSYSWTGSGGATANYLGSAGSIKCTVTDANNCIIEKTIELSQPAELVLDTLLRVASCKEVANGQIHSFVKGGSPAYQFSLDNVNYQADSVFTGLLHGDYTVYVKDQNACMDSIVLVLKHDSVKVFAPNDTTVCENQGVFLTATGMEQMTWNSGANNGGFIIPLDTTDYIVTGFNGNGCESTDTMTVNVIPYLDPTIQEAGPFCGGSPDYQLITADAGGVWSGTGVNSSGVFSPTSVPDGTYDVIYTFPGNCGDADTLSILVNSTFDATINPIAPICELRDSIRLTSITPGGKWWGAGMAGNASDSISPYFKPGLVGGGMHTVTHLIPGECGDTATYTIEVIAADIADIAAVPDFCPSGAVQNLSATPSGGLWSGSGVAANGDFDPSSLPGEGSYKVYYMPAGTCAVMDSATVTIVSELMVITDTVNLNCFGDSNGSINMTVTGGQNPYTYTWPSGVNATGGNANNLSAGSYPVTVTDNLGCSKTVSHQVLQPAALHFVSNHDIVNDSCFNACKGLAQFYVDGGVNPGNYTYNLNGVSQSSNRFANLCAGNYTITVSDDNGCSITDNFVITAPNSLRVFAKLQPDFCNQSKGGVYLDSITGGTAPYQFQWSNATSNDSLLGVLAGSYTLIVTDKNNCTLSQSYTVVNNGGPDLSSAFDSVSCFGGSDGVAYVNATGGTPGYSFVWNTTPVQSGNTASGLSAGNYTATVTDATGCANSINVLVEEPTEVMVSPMADTLICDGLSYDVSYSANGGNGGPYSFVVNGINLPGVSYNTNNPGLISVVAIDPKGCQSPVMNYNMSYLPALDVTPGGPYTVCPGDEVSVSASANGGRGSGYTFTWGNGNVGASVKYRTPESAAIDSIRVIVSDNCPSSPDTGYALINFHPNSVPVASISPASGCVPLDVTLSLASSNYSSIRWNLGDGSQVEHLSSFDHTYLQDGSFTVSVDVVSLEGCENSLVINPPVIVHPLPRGEINQSPEKITVAVGEGRFTVDGAHIVNIDWSLTKDGDTLSTKTGKNFSYDFGEISNNYNLGAILTSPFGCEATIYAPVFVYPEIRVFVPSAFSPNKDGVNEEFGITYSGADFLNFTFRIYDRWGELLFETRDPKFSWDGLYQGDLVRPGMYVWTMTYQGEGDVKQRESGKVMLLD